jgi:predicted ATPase
MKIIKLKIHNFKSLVDVQMASLPSFAVFAGPNGAGKSNLFEAIEFYRDVILIGADVAIQTHEGYESIHSQKFKGERAKKMEFAISFQTEKIYSYSLILRDCNSQVRMEEVYKVDEEEVLYRGRGVLRVKGVKSDVDYADNRTALSLVDEEAKPFLDFIRGCRRYRIDPNKAREPVRQGKDGELDEQASNLSSVLQKLEQSEQDHESIMELIQMLVPSMENVRSEMSSLDGKVYVTFKEIGTRKRFPARLISDGTIYALSLMAIIYGHRTGLAMIEEPERGLHPKAIEELTELFKEIAGRVSPVYINTHSETVVRFTPYENLYMVDKPDGVTRITRIAEKYSNYDYKKMRLDTMWLSNLFDGGIPW